MEIMGYSLLEIFGVGFLLSCGPYTLYWAWSYIQECESCKEDKNKRITYDIKEH